VAALRRADVEQVLAVPGLGRRTAEAVVAALAGGPVGGAAAGNAGPAAAEQISPAGSAPLRTATEANPIPSTSTQHNAAPVNGAGDGVRGGA
jgi:excinuclease ABC subunit C